MGDLACVTPESASYSDCMGDIDILILELRGRG